MITNEFNLSSYVNDVRNFMKEKCIHEQIIHDESKQSNAGRALCPKVATTKVRHVYIYYIKFNFYFVVYDRYLTLSPPMKQRRL